MIVRDSESGNIMLPQELTDDQLLAVIIRAKRAYPEPARREAEVGRYLCEAEVRGIM